MRPSPLRKTEVRHTRGVALIIVLAFVVLLTGLVIAFFSRSLSERQISNSSAGQVKIDLFTQGAIATITDDLKQEIAAGSNATYYSYTDTTSNTTTVNSVYLPDNPATAVPALALVGKQATVTSFPANLVKRSAYNQNFFPGSGDAGASNYNNGNTTATVVEPTAPAATPSPVTAPVRAPSNRAAGLKGNGFSTTIASQNGRAISPARWNKSLLLPKSNPTSSTDNTPYFADPGNSGSTSALSQNKVEFVPPDWILVARDGSNPGSAANSATFGATQNPSVNNPSPVNPGYVTGRFAYTIYDEGGLLDANVAGYPTTAAAYPSSGTASIPVTPTAKTALAYADLTIPVPTDATAPGGNTQPLLTAAQVNALVGWRNFASAQTTGTFPNYTPGPTIYPSPSPSPVYSNFDEAVLSNVNGFMGVSNTPLFNNQSDRMFGSRQELINFFTQGLPTSATDTTTLAALQNSLQYFGTFSRGVNQPSYAPVSRVATVTNPNPRPLIQPSAAVGTLPGGGNNVGDTYTTVAQQDIFSPSLLNVRVPTTVTANPAANLGRSNGSNLVAGEPLVKSRFALQRLAWLTYLGPSVNNMTDTTVQQLTTTYGIPAPYIQQGTAQNIKNYFGLQWDTQKNCWRYNVHNGYNGKPGTPGTGIGAIMKLQDIADQNLREPDFFEMLKASIDPGALAKASTNSPSAESMGSPGLYPLDFQFTRDISLDAAIIQLGANIIDQFDLDGYSTRIIFNDGSGRPEREFRGVENLPYMYRVRTGGMKLRESIQPYSTNSQQVGSAAIPQLAAGFSGPPLGTVGYPVYTAQQLYDTGVGVIMAMPDIWNPHDENCSLGNPRPTAFQMVANSTDPDTVAVGGVSNNFSTSGYAVTTVGTYRGGSNIAYGPTSGLMPSAPGFSRTPTPSGGAGVPMTGGNPANTNSYNTPFPINAANSSTLTFTVSDKTLFREPTMLGEPGGPSQLAMKITNPDVLGVRNASGIACFVANSGFKPVSNLNPLELPSQPTSPVQAYCGIYLGMYPLRWVGPRYSGSDPKSTAWIYTDADLGTGGTPIAALTYDLQYTDQFGKIVTYDEKYVDTDTSFELPLTGDLVQPKGGAFAFVDPRTPRFGSAVEANIADAPHYRAPLNGSNPTWLDQTSISAVTERPGVQSGFGTSFRGNYNNSKDWGYYTAKGWHYQNIDIGTSVNAIWFQGGLFAQNDPYFNSDGYRYLGDTPGVGVADPQFYSDPDGVVRRGMAAYLSEGTAGTVGQPLATSTTFAAGKGTATAQSQSRPTILNRPFRSVAELGYVFSGMPWKNLDFSTPESGYSELLDMFCVNDTNPPNGLVAGKVDLNTRQPVVLKSLLTGAYTDEANSFTGTNSFTSTSKVPTSAAPLAYQDADAIAQLLVARTSTAPKAGNYTSKGPQPLQNVGDLAGRWNSTQTISRTNYTPPLNPSHNIDGSKSYDGFSGDLTPTTITSVSTPNLTTDQLLKIPRLHEGAVRALSNVGNTRVWNLMIDVIAQSGRYPTGASALNNFVVEGEQRYWVHLAIDRYTGAVLDTKVEVVKE